MKPVVRENEWCGICEHINKRGAGGAPVDLFGTESWVALDSPLTLLPSSTFAESLTVHRVLLCGECLRRWYAGDSSVTVYAAQAKRDLMPVGRDS